MSTITTRAGKGSPLTNTELDANFTNLNADKLELGGTYSSGTANGVAYLNGSKVLTTGSALTFDGTNFSVDTSGNPIIKLKTSGAGNNPLYRIQADTNYWDMIGVFSDANDTFRIRYNNTDYYQIDNTGISIWNVGASEQMRLTSIGLGIGTSSPAQKLHVGGNLRLTGNAFGSAASGIFFSGNDSYNAGIYSDGTGNQLIFNSGGVGDRMRLDSSGNLGLGVTPSANGSIYYKAFELGKAGCGLFATTSSMTNSELTYLAGNAVLTYSAGPLWLYGNNGNAAVYGIEDGSHVWHTAPSGTAGNAISFTQAMTLDASGNLGIGNTVAGTVNNNNGSGTLVVGSGSGSQGMTVYSGSATGNEARLTFANASSGAGSYSAQISFKSGDNAVLFYNQNAERMRIDSSGNVGIGTSIPGVKLDVVGTIRSTSGLDLYNATAGNSWSNYHSSDGSLRWYKGSDRLILDSSGNLGLGVTPSAWVSGAKAFQAGLYASIHTNSNLGAAEFMSNAYRSAATTYSYINTNYATRYRQYDGVHSWWTAPSGTAGNAISFTQAMTLDASGNLLVGTTTTPSGVKAAIAGTNTAVSSRGNLYVYTTDSATADYGGTLSLGGSYSGTTEAPFANIAGRWTGSGINGYMQFSTIASGTLTERMRIDSSGSLLINTTSRLESEKLFVKGTTSSSAMAVQVGTDAWYGIRCQNSASTVVGGVIINASSVQYATSSDYRLKENIQPMQNALSVVQQLNPVTYTWKADGSDGQGFIAHELQSVVPDCVTGEKDAVDKEGNPVYQGIDTSFLVATLTKAIQELSAKNDALEARLAALETK